MGRPKKSATKPLIQDTSDFDDGDDLDLEGQPKAREVKRVSPHNRKLQELWTAIIEWRDDNEVTTAEALYQSDTTNESLPELVESLLDITGYAEADDEDVDEDDED